MMSRDQIGFPANNYPDRFPENLCAAVLLAAVKDARRRCDAEALKWLKSEDAAPWAEVVGLDFERITAWCAATASKK